MHTNNLVGASTYSFTVRKSHKEVFVTFGCTGGANWADYIIGLCARVALSSSHTPSLFHFRLKTYLFNKSFPP